ncbi:hypothetical protein [Cohnella xylanilytica]|uniref:hypothetical protein n=1 Tax=Cohnella xylanilytica TaxID=557555 RepID=UPI001BB34D02|nr:hypothetical protein [Cohnella xylanilytica]
MRTKLACLLPLLLCLIVIGSGCSDRTENKAKETATPEPRTPSVFKLDPNRLETVRIKYGDGTVTKEIGDKEVIGEFAKYVNDAKEPSSGSAFTADLPRILELVYEDGSVQTLEVTGSGTVFADTSNRMNYKFNEREIPFLDWVKEQEK